MYGKGKSCRRAGRLSPARADEYEKSRACFKVAFRTRTIRVTRIDALQARCTAGKGETGWEHFRHGPFFRGMFQKRGRQPAESMIEINGDAARDESAPFKGAVYYTDRKCTPVFPATTVT